MEIITSIKFMLRLIGLKLHQSNNCIYTIYSTFWLFISFCFLIPEFTYFYTYANDVIKASDVLIFIAATVMTLFKVSLYNYYKLEYSQLVDEMQENVKKKYQSHREKHYLNAEYYCKIFSQIYGGILTGAVILGSSLPILVVFYHYLMGILTEDIWYLPIPAIMFYDTDTVLGFTLTYILASFSVAGVVYSYCAIDSLFVGMCIHLTAGYKDLQDMIMELNDHLPVVDFRAIEDDGLSLYHNNLDKEKLFILQKKIGKCIRFQTFLTLCFDKLEKVNGGIIFTQFGGVIFIMCASVFQMTTSFESGKIVSYINIWGCYLSQLCVYAIYGNMVASEFTKISTTIYDSLWYRRPPCSRKQFYLMLLKAQTPRYLRGLRLINCSMESFSAVIRASGSAFTVLKSVKENS